MTKIQRRLAGDDRGAVLVHVAIAMLALIAFSALAVDYGALLVSRNQAQNAADAAALAGAMSLAFDDPDDITRAQAGAKAVGEANQVWGAAPSILLGGATPDVRLVSCPPNAPGGACVRADVYRSAARSNPLPTFFAKIVGVTSQDVRATATAQVAKGNASKCLKPWAVADKWEEHWEDGAPSTEAWAPDKEFDRTEDDPRVKTPDVYVPPSANSPGTGFAPFDASGNPTADYGLRMKLKIGSSGDRLSPGWFMALDLPNSGNGANGYRDDIGGCNPTVLKFGDTVQAENGNMKGPTRQAVGDLVATDSGASWNSSTKAIQGSCAPGICGGQYHTTSPRIVPVPVFDIDYFFDTGILRIANIMGFFVEGMDGDDVMGRLVAVPGLIQGTTSVDDTASFMRKVMLVR